ncbi:outer membrane efflux protein [Paludibacter propionicigenes WB4]|uniref:Outer membrane efflux protein n=1 Tax=Paludibacter propionicigenes (strain DSM 17365 / JCM 13257 / WB4) TaxID=694427 RepID=E4T2U1_PALPW|nr:TolC family protein [Paludibacter propionicigenes]ADQ79035.1 outer membrane efflux protein [Paludibacter propionicigenes WB4]
MNKNLLVIIAVAGSVQIQAQKVLQLEDCRQMALAHNKSLQMVQESVKAAKQLKEAAFTQFLPNFSANGAYTRNEKNLSLLSEDANLPVYNMNANGTPNYANSWNNSWKQVAANTYAPMDAAGNVFDPKVNPEKIQWKNYALLPKSAMEFDVQNVFVGSIGFVQPIFMGGKIKELYNIAKYGENLAQAQQESKMTELLLEVDEAYWRVVSLENKVKLAKEYRNLIARVDSNVTDMINEGVATKAEALKVRVKLNEADITMTKAEDGLNLSRMALNQLCGIALDDVYTLADQDLAAETITRLIPIDQALNNRPEIKQLIQLENIAKSNEKIMVSRFLPNIVLSGNYLVTNPNSFDGYKNQFGGMYSIGVVANIPLFHFGDKVHTLNAAKSQHKIATLQLEETKEKMQLQIKQSSYKVAESLKKKTSTEHNVEQAEENLRYATEGFTEGVITSTDLLGAQTAWLSAKSEYIDANIDVKLTNLYLAKSLGTLASDYKTGSQNSANKK